MGHTTQKDLATKVAEAKLKVQVGGVYHHYRNGEQHYDVLAVVLLEETEEVCVVYQAQYGERLIWVRTISNWLDEVEDEQGNKVPRFQLV